MLKLEFRLDCTDFGFVTGRALLIVINQDNANVVDVAMCDITEEQIRDIMSVLYSKHGHVYVHENDGALFDFEYVYLELENKLAKAEKTEKEFA